MAEKETGKAKAPRRRSNAHAIRERMRNNPDGDSAPITVERIVSAAMKLADRKGAEKITMWDIALELGSV
ncbi:MAG: hypothetical protein ABFD98_15545 [Syntrophobacteraceae bacterium]|nr:hypothetical protein [Desulfobacteraceae bacterium]